MTISGYCPPGHTPRHHDVCQLLLDQGHLDSCDCPDHDEAPE